MGWRFAGFRFVREGIWDEWCHFCYCDLVCPDNILEAKLLQQKILNSMRQWESIGLQAKIETSAKLLLETPSSLALMTNLAKAVGDKLSSLPEALQKSISLAVDACMSWLANYKAPTDSPHVLEAEGKVISDLLCNCSVSAEHRGWQKIVETFHSVVAAKSAIDAADSNKPTYHVSELKPLTDNLAKSIRQCDEALVASSAVSANPQKQHALQLFSNALRAVFPQYRKSLQEAAEQVMESRLSTLVEKTVLVAVEKSCPHLHTSLYLNHKVCSQSCVCM